MIAVRVWGDGNLWYLIADTNGVEGEPDALLTAGQALRIPNEVISLPNSAGSFKPFNLNAVLGDTTPTQPLPPAPQNGGGCGVVGQILVTVVAVVVAVYTAGVVAGALKVSAAAASTGTVAPAIAAGAVGGAAGSAVSQGVAIAIGQQKGFNWGGVALAAIGGGVTAGLAAPSALGELIRSTGKAAPLLSSVANSVLTQGIGVLTGVQEHFSWRNVAASALAAPVAGAAGRQAAQVSKGSFGSHLAAGVGGSLVRSAVGGKVDMTSVLVDGFGNALGNSIVDSIVQGQESRKVNDALRRAGLDPNDPYLPESLRQTAQGLVARGNDPSDIAIFLGDKDVQRDIFGAATTAAQAISQFSGDDVGSIAGGGAAYAPQPSGFLGAASGELIEELTVQARGLDAVTKFSVDVLRPLMGAAATFGAFAERHERLATMAAAGTQIAMMGPAQFVKGTVIDMAVGATVGSYLNELDTYIQTKASNWIADRWGLPKDEADFLAHGVSFAGQIVLDSATNVVSGAKNISNVVKRDPVKPLETGRYGDLAPRSVKDGLDIDHSPSFASIRAARERDLGRRLRPEEAAALLRDSSAIAIPADLHRSDSRTYGGRNSPARIQSDSINPNRAIDLDRAAYQRELLQRGYTLEQIDESFDRLKRK